MNLANAVRMDAGMTKAERFSTKVPPGGPAPVLMRELAVAGWVVEVALVIAGNPAERRFFAVGLEDAAEAEEAVLRYPGLMIEDPRTARRPLSANEIISLELRTQAIRPYGSER